MGVRFRILGPLEFWRDGRRCRIGGPQQRGLLAVLLLNANRVVSVPRLVESLWGDDPPATARGLLQGCIADLRRALGPEKTLLTRAPGYVLQVPPDELDLEVFERLAGASRFAEALALWRGPALADIDLQVCRDEAVRLEERRLSVLEQRIDGELGQGLHTGLVAELRVLVKEHPLRERLWAQLMLALYRSGRQAEALAAYQEIRTLLVEELGVDPGPDLRRVHHEILSNVDTGPAQLPAAIAGFTGRREQLEWLGTLAPFAVISGPPGVGKTALALRWAHQERERFPDGQLHVDLRGHSHAAPLPPLDALAGFLQALGVGTQEIPDELERAAALFRTMVADRRLLIVLDNARDVEQVRPLLPGGSGCAVLVTSREELGGLVAVDGAGHLTLGMLTTEEGLELLANVLGAHPDRHAHELVRLCAGLPLALRLAAANALLHEGVAGFVERLRSGDRLDALAVQGDPHRAVRAAFDVSCAALAPGPRDLFRRIGHVPGPDVTADAAAALAGIGATEASSYLERLASAHLVERRGADRYGCHDLLREYAAQLPGGDDGGLQRLFDWYLETADLAGNRLYPQRQRMRPDRPATGPGFQDDATAIGWLDSERANLVAALRHGATHGPHRTVYLLADALRGYFWMRQHPVDWLTVAQAGLQAAQACGDLRGQAAAQLSMCDANVHQSRNETAIQHGELALALARRCGWRHGESECLGILGYTSVRLGRLDEAARRLTEGLAVDRASGNLVGQGAKLAALGGLCLRRGHLDESERHLAEGLAINRRANTASGVGMALANLAEAHLEQGKLDEAWQRLTEAFADLREHPSRPVEGFVLCVLSDVERGRGHVGEAHHLAVAAHQLITEGGVTSLLPRSHLTLAGSYLALGEPEPALDAAGEALRLARAHKTTYMQTLALLGLAEAHRLLGDREQARAHAERAERLARESGYRRLAQRAVSYRSARVKPSDEA